MLLELSLLDERVPVCSRRRPSRLLDDLACLAGEQTHASAMDGISFQGGMGQ